MKDFEEYKAQESQDAPAARRKKRRYVEPGDNSKKDSYREARREAPKSKSVILLQRVAVIALLVILICAGVQFIMGLLTARQDYVVEEALEVTPFASKSDEVLSLANQVLQAENEEELSVLSEQNDNTAKLLPEFMSYVKNDKLSFPKEKVIYNEEYHPPFHYIKTNNSEELPYVYFIEQDGEILLDLESSLGFNSVTAEEINKEDSKEVKGLRVVLSDYIDEHGIYAQIKADMPHGKGALNLRVEEDSDLGKALKLRLSQESQIFAVLEIVRRPTQDSGYLIDAVKSYMWNQ